MKKFLFAFVVASIATVSIVLADGKKIWAREIVIPTGETNAVVRGAWGGGEWARIARLACTNESGTAVTFTVKKIELGNEVTVASSGTVNGRAGYSADWAVGAATNTVADFIVTATASGGAASNLNTRVLIYAE